MANTYPTLLEHAQSQGHDGYKQAVFVYNPNSCNAMTLNEAKVYMKPIQALGFSVEFQQTSRDVGEMTTALAEILTSRTVLLAHAGDGGKRKTFEAFEQVRQLKPELRGLPTAPLRGGRKNDFDCDIDPRNRFKDSSRVITEGRVRTVRPLVGSLQFDDGELPFKSWAHVSAGASGRTSADVNAKRDHWLRKTEPGRWILERQIALSAFLGTPEFIVGRTGEDGRKAVEFMVSNGPQVAGSLHPNTSIFAPEALIIQARKHMGPFVLGALALGSKRVGKQLQEADGPQAYEFHVPKADNMTYVQFDGEEKKVWGDFTLTLGIGSEEDQIHVLTA